MVIKTYSAAVTALETNLVTVELLVKYARQSFSIGGMVGSSVQECRNRITALAYQYEIDLKEISLSINLASQGERKSGSSFDLAIMVGLLKSLGKITVSDSFISETIFLGELSFDGELRSNNNFVPVILDAKKLGMKRVIIPTGKHDYSDFYSDIEVISLDSLAQLFEYLRGDLVIAKKVKAPRQEPKAKVENDFASVRGQQQIKRMLQIAMAGDHNAIMVGPPGSGKTMLANCTRSLAAPMSLADRMEVTRVYSSHQSFNYNLIEGRPFRSPHHSISTVGMTGGGNPIMPGELSLAHKGILFLDELTEFKRSVIENLRQPIESRHINISRASNTISLPCSFTLICSMNPCACGNLGSNKKECLCTTLAIYNYLSKISGPFLDRIDLQAFMHSVDLSTSTANEPMWSTAYLLEGVNKARMAQVYRYGGDHKKNGYMSAQDIDEHCVLDSETKSFMDFCYDKLLMSMRSYHKVIKVARTIADIGGELNIKLEHVKEAFMYRGLDQKLSDLKQRL